ncbi:hypothetical protein [uncultured Tateyamaria sp.]|uniref:hypothetical protein n=1 Tax=uncultured Tateyamaria sp. TaxID=455651 RepID=UPI00262A251C|nr:hypothetical protein [uncultured Tateyamaria sp.]
MRQELDAIPAEAEGAALSRVQIENCMADLDVLKRWICEDAFKDAPEHVRKADARDWCEQQLKPLLAGLDPTKHHVMGEGFGRSGDATDIVIFEIGNDLVRRQRFVVELRNVPFDQQRDILFYVCDRIPRFSKGAMDKGGNGSYLAEILAAAKTSGSYEELLASLDQITPDVTAMANRLAVQLMKARGDGDIDA